MYCVYGNSDRYIHGGPLFGGGPLLGGSVIGGSTVSNWLTSIKFCPFCACRRHEKLQER